MPYRKVYSETGVKTLISYGISPRRSGNGRGTTNYYLQRLITSMKHSETFSYMPNTQLDYSEVKTEFRNCPMTKGDYNTSNGFKTPRMS